MDSRDHRHYQSSVLGRAGLDIVYREQEATPALDLAETAENQLTGRRMTAVVALRVLDWTWAGGRTSSATVEARADSWGCQSLGEAVAAWKAVKAALRCPSLRRAGAGLLVRVTAIAVLLLGRSSGPIEKQVPEQEATLHVPDGGCSPARRLWRLLDAGREDRRSWMSGISPNRLEEWWVMAELAWERLILLDLVRQKR